MTPSALAATYAKAFDDTRGWSADEFAALLAHPNTFLSGMEDSFVIIRVVADEAEILTIATDPAHRRQGHARSALVAGHAQAYSAGAAKIFLEVAADNTPAKALYAALGYKQVGHRPAYYRRRDQAPVAALILSCDLDSA